MSMYTHKGSGLRLIDGLDEVCGAQYINAAHGIPGHKDNATFGKLGTVNIRPRGKPPKEFPIPAGTELLMVYGARYWAGLAKLRAPIPPSDAPPGGKRRARNANSAPAPQKKGKGTKRSNDAPAPRRRHGSATPSARARAPGASATASHIAARPPHPTPAPRAAAKRARAASTTHDSSHPQRAHATRRTRHSAEPPPLAAPLPNAPSAARRNRRNATRSAAASSSMHEHDTQTFPRKDVHNVAQNRKRTRTANDADEHEQQRRRAPARRAPASTSSPAASAPPPPPLASRRPRDPGKTPREKSRDS